MVKSLITCQNLESKDDHGNTPLYYSCLCGHLAVVRHLSDLGARDDKFGRCYWNALSSGIRNLLKLYNDYKKIFGSQMSEIEGGWNDEKTSEKFEDCMERMVKRILFEKTRNAESDLTIRVKFINQEKESEYYCHRWVVLSRCPLFLEFALNKERPIPRKNSIIIASQTIEQFEEIINLKTNREFQNYHFKKYPHEVLLLSEFKAKIRFYRNIAKDMNESLNWQVAYNSRIEKVNQSLPENQIELNTFLDEHFQCIDLGELPFEKSYFDELLYYVYCGKFVFMNSETIMDLLPDFLSGRHPTHFYELMSLFETLGLPSMCFLTWNVAHKIPMDKTVEQVKNNLLDEMESAFFYENDMPSSKIDQLRKMCCNFKLLSKYVDEDEETPSHGQSILCDRNLLIMRSEFFNVMINGQFQEAEHIREMELRHELPCLELLQCSNISNLARYIYSDRVDINLSNVYDYLNNSERMGFVGMHSLCLDFIEENLEEVEDEQVMDMLRLAISFNIQKAKVELERRLRKLLNEQVKVQKVTIENVENVYSNLGYNKVFAYLETGQLVVEFSG